MTISKDRKSVGYTWPLFVICISERYMSRMGVKNGQFKKVFVFNIATTLGAIVIIR